MHVIGYRRTTEIAQIQLNSTLCTRCHTSVYPAIERSELFISHVVVGVRHNKRERKKRSEKKDKWKEQCLSSSTHQIKTSKY